MRKVSWKSLLLGGIITLILGFTLLYLHNSVDFSFITGPFERLTESQQQTSQESGGTIETVMEALGVNKVQAYYIRFQSFMEALEQRVTNLNNPFLVAIGILFFFALKSVINVVPISVTCLLSGLVFPLPVALLINFIGVTEIFLIKYFWGKKQKRNTIHRAMSRIPAIERIVEGEMFDAHHGNPLLLFALRLVPSIPLNPISQLYGYMEFNLLEYISLSLVGISFKLVAYTSIGYNIADPFSSAFIVPIIVVLLVSGFATAGLSIFLKVREYKAKKAKAKVNAG